MIATMEEDLRCRRDKEDIEAKEADTDRQLQLAVALEIHRAEFDVQMLQAKRQRLENEVRGAELDEKSVEMDGREAELQDREHSCTSLLEDHSTVTRDVVYLKKQKVILEDEIVCLIGRHAALATSFRHSLADVKQMPVEP